MVKTITIVSESCERIDKVISHLTKIPRNEVSVLIKQGQVWVGDQRVRKANFQTKMGAQIEIRGRVEKTTKVVAEKMEIKILFEDDYLMVVSKPNGMVVHPSPSHWEGTLVNGLLHHCQQLSSLNGTIRPGIVHRLDKNTTGLLVVAKNNEIHNKLVKLLQNKELVREYKAVCVGKMSHDKMLINLAIGRDPKNRTKMCVSALNSKTAETTVFREKIITTPEKTFSLVRCVLGSGRTHQIRVHLSYVGLPIFGDDVYGESVDDLGQRLHAFKLRFTHPVTGEVLEFEESLPEKKFNLNL